MEFHRHPLYFDTDEFDLLDVLDPLLSGEKQKKQLRRLFAPTLHPRGIKELAAPRSLRIAVAVFDLIRSLEGESAEERLRTLRAVRAEVLHSDSTSMCMNTARVLLQTMKELVRCQDDPLRQLELANDFKAAAAGRPRFVRWALSRHHLLEMPEEWNQMAFDFHVHDANSKGRKTPTHLIMDAWIKGIRHLGVIYYNHFTRNAVSELLEAANIMDVHLRTGVELPALYRGRYVHLIWAPRGFHSNEDFVAFLEEPGTRKLMEQGRDVSRFRERQYYALLRSFNERHLPGLNAELGISLPPLEESAFRAFVGAGQTSRLHLAEFIHASLLPHLERRVAELQGKGAEAVATTGISPEERVDAMNRMVPETIAERFLSTQANPQLPDPALQVHGDHVPELLRLDIPALLDRFEGAPRGNRTILNASGLEPEEVLEILYLAEGRITHIEIFNLKDWADEGVERQEQICRVRRVINRGNILETKRLCLALLERVEASEHPDREDRAHAIKKIIRDIPRLIGFYREGHLKSRLGSDSTGRSRNSLGMGLVAVSTLPWRARKQVRREGRLLPVHTVACRRVLSVPKGGTGALTRLGFHLLRHTPVLRPLGYHRRVEWFPRENATHVAPRGNIAALGGHPEESDNGLVSCTALHVANRGDTPSLRHLRTPIKNILKVVIGLVPAFLTFLTTKDWWLLAYLGAPIWFGITGLRNIVQSVLGGGGLVRSPLLKWRDFVSWSRVADSLLFTGFSVPLLDLLVKQQLLSNHMGITTATNPLLLYTVMALANGVYISSHNLFRGLPTAAAAGNFFRTVLSIPIAIGFNAALLHLAMSRGITEAVADAQLQLWATVISKLASDMVAGVIEGLADRSRNMTMRAVDYQEKLHRLNEVFGELSVIFPENDVLEMLQRPDDLARSLESHGNDLFQRLTTNALDLMYFWFHQPRGRDMFREILEKASVEERKMVLRVQRVLLRKRAISGMFLDGLVGKRFDRALAFYLGRIDSYLAAMEKLESKLGVRGGTTS